jgi:hypothetical protein
MAIDYVETLCVKYTEVTGEYPMRFKLETQIVVGFTEPLDFDEMQRIGDKLESEGIERINFVPDELVVFVSTEEMVRDLEGKLNQLMELVRYCCTKIEIKMVKSLRKV